MSDDSGTNIEIREGQLVLRGKCITIRSLEVNGTDECAEFVRGIDPRSAAGRKFLEKVLGYVRVVADEAEACSDEYFRHLVGDQWEIRIQQGKANHRFYGFLTQDRVFYMVRYADKQWRRALPRDLAHVAWVREKWLLMTDEH